MPVDDSEWADCHMMVSEPEKVHLTSHHTAHHHIVAVGGVNGRCGLQPVYISHRVHGFASHVMRHHHNIPAVNPVALIELIKAHNMKA